MKRGILLCTALMGMAVLHSCSKSEELAPKTGEINSGYLLPKGSLLTSEEREIVNKRLEEYTDATR